MLKAYFDESGIHGKSPICVVAGLVMTSKSAARLSKDWQTALLFKYGIPYFHAKEFAQRRGPFDAWRDWKVREFSVDAVAVINSSIDILERHMFIAAALTSKDFFALSLDERRWLTGGSFVISGDSTTKKWKKQGAPTKPYFLLFQQAVIDAVKFTEEQNYQGERIGTGDVVHFIFDQQREYEVTARAVFRTMKQSPLSVRTRIGDVVFSSKLRAIPLQVADFIAYEAFSYLNHREYLGRETITNQTDRLIGAWRRGWDRYVFIDGVVLKRLLDFCPLTPRKYFLPPDP